MGILTLYLLPIVLAPVWALFDLFNPRGTNQFWDLVILAVVPYTLFYVVSH